MGARQLGVRVSAEEDLGDWEALGVSFRDTCFWEIMDCFLSSTLACVELWRRGVEKSRQDFAAAKQRQRRLRCKQEKQG